MTDQPDAVPAEERANVDTEPVQEPLPGAPTPVDSGPGQHHANANTGDTAVQHSQVTHRF
jgi:hypothetical protein